MSKKQNVSSFFALLVATFMLSFTWASENETHESHKTSTHHDDAAHADHQGGHDDAHGAHDEKFDVTKTIMEHVTDAHEYHLWGGHHDATSIYLPIILMDQGMKVFSSTHFYHGEPFKELLISLDTVYNVKGDVNSGIKEVTIDTNEIEGKRGVGLQPSTMFFLMKKFTN